jgi:NAD-dependent deacetylase
MEAIGVGTLVAFTGAGISRQSGIPTFNEMEGIRDKLTREYFNNNPKDFYDVLKMFKRKSEQAQPNRAHLVLAEYGVDVVTMNIDGLHKRAGSKNVIEVHGNMDIVLCTNCNVEYDFRVIFDSIYCTKCKEVLQPNVVLYGDLIARYFDAINVIGKADTLLVVGTSFYTSTAGDFVGRAKMAGIKVVTINDDAEKNVPRFVEEYFKDNSSK